jgi:cytochrome c-type biogenesis protein CcmH/NrfG
VRRNDLDARGHFYRRRPALVEGVLDAAIEELKRAVELQGAESDYHLWYGKAMTRRALQAQNPLLAMGVRAQLERAVALDGRNVDARDALADFYSMTPAMMGGDTDQAGAAHQRPLELDPRNEEARKAMK